jgi:hypothetical protein
MHWRRDLNPERTTPGLAVLRLAAKRYASPPAETECETPDLPRFGVKALKKPVA